jgi:glutathione peroxidase
MIRIPGRKEQHMSVYDFVMKDAEGTDVSLADYKGKVLLIVNTATGCGFTPQYNGLEELYEKYRDKGFEILDFPCNQFGEQAPGTDAEITEFCTINFGVSFKQFSKIDVNGENASPIFKYLVENSKFEGFGMSPAGLAMKAVAKMHDSDYKNNSAIKWNFTKFLISRDGKILARFEPTVSMEKVREAVEAAL